MKIPLTNVVNRQDLYLSDKTDNALDGEHASPF